MALLLHPNFAVTHAQFALLVDDLLARAAGGILDGSNMKPGPLPFGDAWCRTCRPRRPAPSGSCPGAPSARTSGMTVSGHTSSGVQDAVAVVVHLEDFLDDHLSLKTRPVALNGPSSNVQLNTVRSVEIVGARGRRGCPETTGCRPCRSHGNYPGTVRRSLLG